MSPSNVLSLPSLKLTEIPSCYVDPRDAWRQPNPQSCSATEPEPDFLPLYVLRDTACEARDAEARTQQAALSSQRTCEQMFEHGVPRASELFLMLLRMLMPMPCLDA